MQTFLPSKSFVTSASVLDYRRLGKQRVEAKQVLQAILDVDKHGEPGNTGQGFINHPIFAMWRPYPEALLSYTWYICKEWRNRGFNDGILPWLFTAARLRDMRLRTQRSIMQDPEACPWWLGAPRLHIYHRANLVVKMPDHYLQFGWDIPARLQVGFGYCWPLSTPGEWRVIRRDAR